MEIKEGTFEAAVKEWQQKKDDQEARLVWGKLYRPSPSETSRMRAIEHSIRVLHHRTQQLQDQNIQQDEEQGLKIHELEQLVKQEQEKRVRQSLRIIELEHRIKKLEEEKNA